MCGIVGVLGARPSDARAVAIALDRIRSRGPDHSALLHGDAVLLAYNRLAIRGLGASGNQPLRDCTGHVVLFGVGEIYNYQPLRSRLEADGCRFQGDSDLEVCVHLYEQHGPDFLHLLRGDFTLAIWDEAVGRALLARDPFGVKPLFMTAHGPRVVFASEVKALIPFIDSPALDWAAVAEILTFNYPLAPRTVYEGIVTLPPGTSLEWDAATGATKARAFHRLEYLCDVSADQTIETALTEAVSDRTVADVPIGAHLSGGLDSSLVSHLASQAVPLHTFTAGFDPHEGDLYWAAKVAREIGSIHHPLTLSLRAPFTLLDEAIRLLDGPVMSTGAFTPLLVARSARHEGIKVLLAGQGADEVFRGYARFAEAARRPGLSSADMFALCANVDAVTIERFTRTQGGPLSRALDELPKRFIDELPDENPQRQFQLLYMRTFLQELLKIEDHVHMASSIENRVPFLDDRVVAVGLSAPNESGKSTLRRMLDARGSAAARRFDKQQMAQPPVDFVRRNQEAIIAELRSGRRLPDLNYESMIKAAARAQPTTSEARLLWAVYNLHRHSVVMQM